MESGGLPRGGRGRGRPYQALQPLGVGAGSSAARRLMVAWLLRVNRLFGADDRFIKIDRFASAFRGVRWPGGVSPSTVSRWETGRMRVTYEAVRQYELLLGLPTNHLVAVIDTINRYWGLAAGAAPALGRDATDQDHRRLADLLDRACSTAPMTGAQWDELTALVVATRDLFVPRQIWSRVCGRLLAETIIADKLPWFMRFEAFNRLLAYGPSQAAAIDACASLAMDRTNIVFIETVCALDGTRHPDANRHIVAQLMNPTNDRALAGALLACVRKLKAAHFTPSQLDVVATAVTDLLSDPRGAGTAEVLAVGLLRQLPTAGSRVAASLTRRVRGAGILSQVLTTGRLRTRDTATTLVDRVVNTTLAHTPREVPGFTDGFLPHLLDEVLFNPVFDVRLYCVSLIHATPYKEPLAAALATELAHGRPGDDVDLATALVDAMKMVGGPEQRPLLERLTLAPGVPPAVSTTAAWSVGHIKSDAGRQCQYWTKAINAHARAWRRRRDATSASTLTALVYGLGIARNDPLLRTLRDDAEMPQPVRAASSWWLNLPGEVYRSAGR